MTHLAQSSVRPALAMGRTLGTAILALAILLGVSGTLRSVAAAAPEPATHALVSFDKADQGGFLLAGHKVHKGFKPGFGHGLKHGHAFKHGHGFKKKGFVFKKGHGFKKGHAFKHGHSFKRGHGFKKKGFVLKKGHGFKHGHGFKRHHFGKGFFFKKGFGHHS